MNKIFDNISIQKEMIDISEYISNIEFGIKHIPDKLAFGKLPRNYNKQIFLNKVNRIFKNELGEYTTPEENFNFVLWFLNRAKKKQKLNYINEFAFGLRGIGLLKNEQKYWINKLGFEEKIINTLLFKMPIEDFYPEILPLELFELIRRIPEINSMRTWRNQSKKAAQILSLIYQSMHINYEYGKETGNFFAFWF